MDLEPSKNLPVSSETLEDQLNEKLSTDYNKLDTLIAQSRQRAINLKCLGTDLNWRLETYNTPWKYPHNSKKLNATGFGGGRFLSPFVSLLLNLWDSFWEISWQFLGSFCAVFRQFLGSFWAVDEP